METDFIRSAASINAEEAHYAGIQEELDAEASELRLSVIEHLDRQHVDECADLDLLTTGDVYLWGHKKQVAECEDRCIALSDALEIVRNIEARA